MRPWAAAQKRVALLVHHLAVASKERDQSVSRLDEAGGELRAAEMRLDKLRGQNKEVIDECASLRGKFAHSLTLVKAYQQQLQAQETQHAEERRGLQERMMKMSAEQSKLQALILSAQQARLAKGDVADAASQTAQEGDEGAQTPAEGAGAPSAAASAAAPAAATAGDAGAEAVDPAEAAREAVAQLASLADSLASRHAAQAAAPAPPSAPPTADASSGTDTPPAKPGAAAPPPTDTQPVATAAQPAPDAAEPAAGSGSPQRPSAPAARGGGQSGSRLTFAPGVKTESNDASNRTVVQSAPPAESDAAGRAEPPAEPEPEPQPDSPA